MTVLRRGSAGDLEAVAALEALCFPPEEAADRETLAGRLAVYPEHFLLLREDGELVAFLDGFCTPEPDLRDEMYADPSLHREDGAWQMIFGVAARPDRRGRGYATRLLEHLIRDTREAGRLGLVLTCKKPLRSFYARLGFRDEGVTEESIHGGVRWHQMRLRFSEESSSEESVSASPLSGAAVSGFADRLRQSRPRPSGQVERPEQRYGSGGRGSPSDLFPG